MNTVLFGKHMRHYCKNIALRIQRIKLRKLSQSKFENSGYYEKFYEKLSHEVHIIDAQITLALRRAETGTIGYEPELNEALQTNTYVKIERGERSPALPYLDEPLLITAPVDLNPKKVTTRDQSGSIDFNCARCIERLQRFLQLSPC
jgi:hypothetical protein